VLAAYLATQLGINCATYRLEKFEGLDGVASKLIGIESSGPLLGNELLFQAGMGNYLRDKVWGTDWKLPPRLTMRRRWLRPYAMMNE
jgi:hypothetical protein